MDWLTQMQNGKTSQTRVFSLGLIQCKRLPLLFYKRQNWKLVSVVASIVDDNKTSRTRNNAKEFFETFGLKCKSGTVANGPSILRSSEINKTQEEDFTISTNADDKLNSLTE